MQHSIASCKNFAEGTFHVVTTKSSCSSDCFHQHTGKIHRIHRAKLLINYQLVINLKDFSD